MVQVFVDLATASYNLKPFLPPVFYSFFIDVAKMSLGKSSNEDSVCESVSGGAASFSGASLTAAVLTHVHHDDSESSVCSNRESDGDRGGGREEGGEREVELCENGGAVLKSPLRTLRRRSKHSPSKKRESECTVVF